MPTIEIEVGDDAKRSQCHCCGVESKTGHGFVYKDGDARAVYYAGWTPAHPERGVTLAIAIGDWSDEATSGDRVCFGLDAYEGEHEILFRFVEPEDSPWPVTELFGTMLDRNEALVHPLSNEALAIAEAITRQHSAIHGYLGMSS
jgi:hypothetical protein